jgi:hypothetical protein
MILVFVELAYFTLSVTFNHYNQIRFVLTSIYRRKPRIIELINLLIVTRQVSVRVRIEILGLKFQSPQV